MEPGTPEAFAILTLALEHSGRLGHRYIGGEHLLLALVSSGQPAGALLREHGVTPQRVEEEIVRHAGHGAGAGLFGSLDWDALAAIGIDLGAVRARIESSFEADALAHAGRAVQRGARAARLSLPRPRRDVPAWLMARWLRRRAAAMEPILWVPTMPSPHATCEYSWIRPPSRSRRRTRKLSSAGAAGILASGGLWLRVRCGRWVL
jgi:hypothetical protein